MKHKRLTALVLAGCGGTKSSSGSAAASQSTGSSQNAPALATQKERITEQFTLEKTIRQYEWDSAQKLTIHVPQLVCDSPDAESINDELAARYAAEYRDYESYPQAEVSQDEWCPQIYIDWDAYWYGDCVSLVVSSYYGGTDPIYTQGWCFDFASGNQLTVTQMLQRMGADPVALEEALYRDVKRRDELDRQAAIERGLLPTGSLKEGNTAWWTSLDELPFSLDGKENISFVVSRFSAAQEEYVDDKVTLPLDAQPLPQDWEWQVLAEWMATTAVTQGESYAPADRNENFILRLEQTEITGTVTVSFIRETYVSPQIQSAVETRTGELNAGAVTGWDGEKSQGWNLKCLSEDGRSNWTISRMEDGSLLMQSTGLKKGSTVWYVFRRTGAWDDIGFSAIPRRLWGTYRAGDEAAKGIRWMTFLPDGSCCMSVEWDGWSGILTGTAEGTQGRTEDGTELHFTLTDTDGRPCEFWAILLNDDGSPSGCSLKYRAGEVLFDRNTRPIYWKNDSPDLTLVP